MFNRPPNHYNPKITMGDTVLDSCTSYEYLGIILDNNITFKSTIGKNVSSASNRCYMLGNMRRRMSTQTAILVYKQTILPVLEYCGYLFNGVIDTQHKRLQLLQNRGLRISLNVQKCYHISDLHKEAKVDYLSVRYDTQLLLLIHKYMYSGSHDPAELGLAFQKPVSGGRITRSTNTGLLIYPPSNTMSYRKSPLYRAIALWNSLDCSFRILADRESFRTKIKPFLVHLFNVKHNIIH